MLTRPFTVSLPPMPRSRLIEAHRLVVTRKVAFRLQKPGTFVKSFILHIFLHSVLIVCIIPVKQGEE